MAAPAPDLRRILDLAAGAPLLVVAADRGRMRRLKDALSAAAPGLPLMAIPEWDCQPYDRLSPSPRNTADRMEDLARLALEAAPRRRVVLATAAALLQRVPPRAALAAAVFRARRGDGLDTAELRRCLLRGGYYPAIGAVDEPGEFTIAADAAEIFPPEADGPATLVLGGGRVATIRRGDEELEGLDLHPTAEMVLDSAAVRRFQDGYLAEFGAHAADDHLLRAVAAGRRQPGLEHWLPLFHETMETLLDYLPGAVVALEAEAAERRDLRLGQIADAHAGRLSMLALQDGPAAYRPLPPARLFLDAAEWDALLARRTVETLPAPAPEPAQARHRRFGLSGLDEIRIGERVVHEEHGLALCDGLEVVEAGEAPRDCVRLLFRGDAKLLVPADMVDLLWRYGEAGGPQLDRLGGDAWTRRRDTVAAELMPAARKLVRALEARQSARVPPLEPDAAYRRFAARFPHEETAGQAAAVADVLADLAAGRPMERLVCGDVGYGKTEVALRAAFVAARAGVQVAVVVPTTPLCRQHVDLFRQRFAGFGLRVAQLSRSVEPDEAAAAKKGLRDGSVAVVVGTQALLGQDVGFARLGLLVVDEEQRLGVRDKERLRALGEGVHVLTMTATPIPRTLELALSGLREVSLIDTPPVARQPVRTVAAADSDAILHQAIARERERGGQSFVVCPRVADLAPLRRRLAALFPDLDVVTAHGRLAPAALDEVMAGFAGGRHEVLLSTNIVEAGLDIPNANTLVVHRADRFGLAQLHQLRGRVGRGGRRGRAWLTFDPGQEMTEEARRRLEVLTTVTDPGAGYALAGRDLEIRGAGDLLGEAQSGHVRAVGGPFMRHLLRRAVEAVRDGAGSPLAQRPPRLQLGVPLLVPAEWVPDPAQRLAVYRAAAGLERPGEAADLAAALAARFGPAPPELDLLLGSGEIKRLCRDLGVAALEAGPRGAVLHFAAGGEEKHLDDWAAPAARISGVLHFLQSRLRTGRNGRRSPAQGIAREA